MRYVCHLPTRCPLIISARGIWIERLCSCVTSWAAVDSRRTKLYYPQNRSSFRKVWASATRILPVLAFAYRKLQDPDCWLSVPVQAGLPLLSFWTLVQKVSSKSSCPGSNQSLSDLDDWEVTPLSIRAPKVLFLIYFLFFQRKVPF